jgi:hypothetical protein
MPEGTWHRHDKLSEPPFSPILLGLDTPGLFALRWCGYYPGVQSQTSRRVSTLERRTSFRSLPLKREPKLPSVSSICLDLPRPRVPISMTLVDRQSAEGVLSQKLQLQKSHESPFACRTPNVLRSPLSHTLCVPGVGQNLRVWLPFGTYSLLLHVCAAATFSPVDAIYMTSIGRCSVCSVVIHNDPETEKPHAN